MALHSDHPFGDRPEDLIEELTRFGLIDPSRGGRRQRDDRLRSKAPQMPVPEIRRTEGGPLPMMPMAAPPMGDPMQMLGGGGGGGGPNIFRDFLQSQATKLVGGFDPLAAGGQGINWSAGRQGQTGSALAK